MSLEHWKITFLRGEYFHLWTWHAKNVVTGKELTPRQLPQGPSASLEKAEKQARIAIENYERGPISVEKMGDELTQEIRG